MNEENLLNKALLRAFYRENGGVIYDELAKSPVYNAPEPMPFLKLPLVAETKVMLDSNAITDPAIIIRSQGWTTSGGVKIGFQQMFSTAEVDAGDIVAMMQYTIEKSAHSLVAELMRSRKK